MLILSIEMLLTYAFTHSLFPCLLVLAALYTPLCLKLRNRTAAALLTTIGVLALMIFFYLSSAYFSVTVTVLIIVQILQVVLYVFGLQPFSSSTWYAVHLRAVMNTPLLSLGFVSVYIAFSDNAAVHPLISDAIGTILLILLVLEIENCFVPHAEETATMERSRFSRVRLGIICLMLATTVSLSGLAITPLRNISQHVSDWADSLKWHRRSLPTAQPKPATEKEQLQPDQPGRYTLRRSLELEDRYNRDVPHIPELHVVVHSAEPERHPLDERLYIRCGSLDTFSKQTWINREEDAEVIRDEDDGYRDGTIVLTTQVRNPITYTVCMRSTPSRLMPSIPTVAAVEQRVVGRKANDVFFSPMPLDNVRTLAYTMTSSDVRWEDLSRGLHVPGKIDARYTHLDDSELTAKIRSYVSGAVGDAKEGRLKIERLRRSLWNECSYSLNMKNEQDLHPIDNFLFHEKQGHCELFASSFVLMLRAAGIPSRLAFGYVGGEYDDQDQVYTFYRDHGHAWVEIYLKRFGWITFDPTPPSPEVPSAPVQIRRSGAFKLNDYPSMATLVNARFPVEEDLAPRRAYGWLKKLLSKPWLLVDTVILAIAIGFVVASRAFGGSTNERSARKRSARPAPSYFNRFCRRFARQGCKIRNNQTAREYLAELQRRGLTQDQHEELISYFEETTYASRPRSRTTEDTLNRTK